MKHLFYKGVVLALTALGISCGTRGTGPILDDDDQSDTLWDTIVIQPLYGVVTPKLILINSDEPVISEIIVSDTVENVVGTDN
ncbi:MAG TPA: hypothetical protein PLF13_06035 [candidate division Zixibacteria bacterium]|nr:hypothetical protein [candidate division Zixibacteria bacterium]